ncbi:hypothetical protein [Pseudomonas sp. LP_7_YM]|uniref:hypothetical protein n=1 Tax=Pseudomonas sp. LP_7_YM TaxID=2485137 RepID=UPI00106192A6|nr:hypothetical protein [Pseudomonas sp. LP_7_YM]
MGSTLANAFALRRTCVASWWPSDRKSPASGPGVVVVIACSQGSGHALILLYQTIRTIVGDTLMDQTARTVLCKDWQVRLPGVMQPAQQGFFAGWHGERARGQEAKSEGDEWVFHRVMLMKIVGDERETHFIGLPLIKKFKGPMVTIDGND